MNPSRPLAVVAQALPVQQLQRAPLGSLDNVAGPGGSSGVPSKKRKELKVSEEAYNATAALLQRYKATPGPAEWRPNTMGQVAEVAVRTLGNLHEVPRLGRAEPAVVQQLYGHVNEVQRLRAAGGAARGAARRRARERREPARPSLRAGGQARARARALAHSARGPRG
jgi:hypothetical protein